MMTIKWLISIAGVLMMTATTGCAANGIDEVKVPGNYDYGINFKIDWKVFESGTYIYGPLGSTVRRLGGARLGYELFFDLTLDFRFKDGREYHEKIDIRPLIREMVKKHDIPDMTKTKWGGGADLIISINVDKLSMVYEVQESLWKERTKQMFYKYYRYPVFEKTLD
jgi:hypothetical protein